MIRRPTSVGSLAPACATARRRTHPVGGAATARGGEKPNKERSNQLRATPASPTKGRGAVGD